MLQRFWSWMRSEEGQAMSEYGLVLAIAAVGVIAVLVTFRQRLVALFQAVTGQITEQTSNLGG